MNTKERYLYLCVIFLLAAGLLYLTGQVRAAAPDTYLQQKLDQAEGRITTLQAALEEQKQKVAQLSQARQEESDYPLLRFQSNDVGELQKAGLSEPGSQVVADLVSRWDLLPIKGVLGGTMMFRPSGGWVITSRWVLAYFDDGHIGGRGLFRYTVKDGKIDWTLVDWERL